MIAEVRTEVIVVAFKSFDLGNQLSNQLGDRSKSDFGSYYALEKY